MDHQVHLPVGSLAELAHHLVVLVHVQLLQVLGGDQLQLLQDVDGAPKAVRRKAHGGGGLEKNVPEEEEEEQLPIAGDGRSLAVFLNMEDGEILLLMQLFSLMVRYTRRPRQTHSHLADEWKTLRQCKRGRSLLEQQEMLE